MLSAITAGAILAAVGVAFWALYAVVELARFAVYKMDGGRLGLVEYLKRAGVI